MTQHTISKSRAWFEAYLAAPVTAQAVTIGLFWTDLLLVCSALNDRRYHDALLYTLVFLYLPFNFGRSFERASVILLTLNLIAGLLLQLGI